MTDFLGVEIGLEDEESEDKKNEWSVFDVCITVWNSFLSAIRAFASFFR